MKSRVVLALAASILFAATALAGEGPFVRDKVRGRVSHNKTWLVPNHVTHWGGPQGVHKEGDTALVRAGLYIRVSNGCPPVGATLEALASPDLFNQLNGKSLLIPLAPMEFHEVKIVGRNDSGDDAMLYMCLPGWQEAEEWADSVSLVK